MINSVWAELSAMSVCIGTLQKYVLDAETVLLVIIFDWIRGETNNHKLVNPAVGGEKVGPSSLWEM